MDKEKKLLCETIDLDLVDDDEIAVFYLQAKETAKYLTDFCASIEAQVKNGKNIPHMMIVDGRSTRYITDNGIKALEKIYGDKVFSKKIITIGELEKMVGSEKMDEYMQSGIIGTKPPLPVITVDLNK